MARVTDIVSASGARPVFMCDFSPPRDPSTNWLDQALSLSPDLFNIPYLAPHPTRPDSITASHLIRDYTRTEVVFNLATRDSNRPKLLDKLSCSRDLALENVVVLQGDADRGVADTSCAERFSPTGLIRELKRSGWDFCVGAVADLTKGVEREADLCHQKIEAGADFLLVQPTFDFAATEKFLSQAALSVPLFFGVHVLAKDGIYFTPTPDTLHLRIERDNASVEVTVETINRFLQLGIRCFYLIAPIFPGGARDYVMARQVMDFFITPRPIPGTPV